MAAQANVQTRLIPFGAHHTWVQTTEPAVPRPGTLPLFVLHGGPGMAHDYVRTIAELAPRPAAWWSTTTNWAAAGAHTCPTPRRTSEPRGLSVAEFHNVRTALGIEDYHLLGQSWGGMLAAEIAVRRPPGLAGLVICHSPASMRLWVQAAFRRRADRDRWRARRTQRAG